MRPFYVAPLIVAALASPLACGTKADPIPQNETGNDGGALHDADGGATATVDTAKLGAPCTNSAACPDGGCFEFGAVEPPIDGGRP